MAGMEKLAELKEDTKKEAAPSKEDKKEEAVQETTIKIEPVIDEHGRSYGTGRRKSSIARVWIKRGNGKVTVNDKDIREYFARPTQQLIINQAFTVANREGEFDVICTVTGGGLSGQAGAVRHGISRAMVEFEPDLRKPLKAAGFLTRDSRKVERKKPGLKKARRSPQWKKR